MDELACKARLPDSKAKELADELMSLGALHVAELFTYRLGVIECLRAVAAI